MERNRAHLRIYGRVQGVFYRASSKNKAKSLLLDGWVKNLSDGSVEAVVEGEKEKIEKFIEWCKIGPSAADVDRVDVTWEDYTNNFSNFEIRYM